MYRNILEFFPKYIQINDSPVGRNKNTPTVSSKEGQNNYVLTNSSTQEGSDTRPIF